MSDFQILEACDPPFTVVDPGGAEVVEVILPGPQGPSPNVPAYLKANVAPVAGVLTINFLMGKSFKVAMTGNVTSVVFQNVPVDKSQSVVLYFIQDATGGRTLPPKASWPAGTLLPSGAAPVLSAAPNSIDQVVVEALDGNFFVALAALNYQ